MLCEPSLPIDDERWSLAFMELLAASAAYHDAHWAWCPIRGLGDARHRLEKARRAVRLAAVSGEG